MQRHEIDCCLTIYAVSFCSRVDLAQFLLRWAQFYNPFILWQPLWPQNCILWFSAINATRECNRYETHCRALCSLQCLVLLCWCVFKAVAKATVISCQRGVCTGFWLIALLPLIIGISMTFTTISDRFKDIKELWYHMCYPRSIDNYPGLLMILKQNWKAALFGSFKVNRICMVCCDVVRPLSHVMFSALIWPETESSGNDSLRKQSACYPDQRIMFSAHAASAIAASSARYRHWF